MTPKSAPRPTTLPSALAELLAAKLPSYMVPAAFVILDELPLTPNGKVDRDALPDVDVIGSADHVVPRSRMEAALCDIVARVLNVGSVGVRDDFFALGGHSLLLVRLSTVLRRELGVDLPVADLFTTPTVAALARRIGGAGPSGDAMTPVLVLNDGGRRPPLFCVHPASGLSWQFAGLKRHLPEDIPLIGLQSPWLSRTEGLPVTMRELAHEYADLVAGVAPDGPVRLLGWSFGGALAHMMAVELAARGRTVTFLGMLDARADMVDPILGRPAGVWDGPAAIVGLLTEMGYQVPEDLRATMSVADAVTFVRELGGGVATLDDAQIARVVENYLASDRMMASAQYDVFGGNVVFIDATVPEQGFTGQASPAWRDHVAGELRAYPVECAHSELLDPPALEILGPLIARHLAED